MSPTPEPDPADLGLQDQDTFPIGVYLVYRDAAPDEPPPFLSPMAQAILGSDHPFLSPEAYRRRRVHPQDRERFDARNAEARRTGHWDHEYRIVDDTGGVRWVHGRADVTEDFTDRAIWVGSVMDVTPGHVSGDAPATSKARYQDLAERFPVVVYIDADEREPRSLFASPNVTELLGHEPRAYLADPGLWRRTVHPEDLERVLHVWEEARDAQDPVEIEYRLVRPDGEVVWVRDRTMPVLDEDGSTMFWAGVMEDIGERRLATDVVGGEASRYRALVEQLPAIVYVDAHDPHERYVSPNVAEILGYPVKAFQGPGTPWIRILHPADRERVLDTWSEAWSSRRPYELEYRYVAADGRSVWVRDSVRPVVRDDGSVLWQGVLLDISREKEAELAREASEQRFRALVEQVPAIVYEMGPDDDRRTLYVSPHAEELLGYTREEWLDQPDIWTELLHPTDREVELAAHDEANRTGAPWDREYRLVAADGSVVWVRDQAKLVRDLSNGEASWHGVMLDITRGKELEERLRLMNDELEHRVAERTAELAVANELMGLEIGERRRVEGALRAADERYRTLLGHLPGVVYVWEVNHGDPDVGDPATPNLAYTNRQIESMLGYTAAEWQETGFWKSRLHPHDRDGVAAMVEKCQQTGDPFEAEYRYLARDGRVVWVVDRATMLSRDDRGRPHLYQGVMLDVTARHHAEDRVDALEDRQRAMIAESPAISWIVRDRDEDPAVRWRSGEISQRLTDVLGYSVEGFAPLGWTEHVHPDDLERAIAASEAYWATGAAWHDDVRMIAKDGRVVWLRVEGRTIERDESGLPTVYQGVLLDIDDRKRRELAVQADRDQLRSVLDGMPAVAWSEEVDSATGITRFTYISPTVEQMLGYTPDELIAEPGHFRRLLHPDDRRGAIERSERTDRTGEPWMDEFRVIRRDGSVAWLLGTGRRVSEKGAPIGVWHGVTVDVTLMHDPDAWEPMDASVAERTDP
jgi:PAS domain S-box-containing protein